MTQEQDLPKIAMVIMAHPDDSEFGCAGTIAGWTSQGWEAYYVICTDGSGGGSDEATDVGEAARQHVRETRQREQRAAAEVLGVREVIFLGYPDGRLEPTLDLRRDIVRVLRRYRPSRVIIPSPDRSWTPALPIPRYHPDHLAAGRAAIAALYPASQNPWDFPELLEEGLAPHKVKQIYVTGAPALNHFVDISDQIDTKLKALRAHDSQVGIGFSETEKRVRGWGKALGEKYGVEYAEEFHYTENP